MPSLSIIILTYNSTRYITPFLDSLFDLYGEKIASKEFELIIFDNNSTDDSIKLAKNYLKKFSTQELADGKEMEKSSSSIKIISSTENLGYAKGINHAFAYVSSKYFLVLNPDAQVLKIDIKNLEKLFEEGKSTLAIGGRLESYEGVPEKSIGKFYSPLTFLIFSLGFEEMFHLRYSLNTTSEVDFLSGGAIAFRSEYFKKMNGYDEKYFMYVEDMDICFRARKSGYKILFSPVVILKHKGQGSSNRTFAIVNIYKGLSIFYKLHGAFLQYIYVRLLLMVKAYLIIVMGMIMNKPRLSATYKEAVKALQ